MQSWKLAVGLFFSMTLSGLGAVPTSVSANPTQESHEYLTLGGVDVGSVPVAGGLLGLFPLNSDPADAASERSTYAIRERFERHDPGA